MTAQPSQQQDAVSALGQGASGGLCPVFWGWGGKGVPTLNPLNFQRELFRQVDTYHACLEQTLSSVSQGHGLQGNCLHLP